MNIKKIAEIAFELYSVKVTGETFSSYYGRKMFVVTGSRGEQVTTGETPEDALGKAKKYYRDMLRRELPEWLWCTAPYRYYIGNSGNQGRVEVFSVTLTKVIWKIRKWFAEKKLKGKKPSPDSPLWVEWFFDSDHPHFKWGDWSDRVLKE